MGNTLGYTRLIITFLIKPCRTDTSLLTTFLNDRMAERCTTLRNLPPPYWFYRGLPGGYPIVHPVLAGRAE